MQTISVNGVTVGDRFKQGKNIICEVLDICEIRSLKTGALKGHVCIAEGIATLAQNQFEVPFATVQRKVYSYHS